MSQFVDRRTLIKRGLVLAAAGSAPVRIAAAASALSFDEYRSRDALGLAELVRSGEVSAPELLEIAIARSQAVNPVINCLVERLYDYARAAVARGLPSGPFTGVPFLLKDLGMHLAGTVTTNGSRFYRDAVADYTNTVVSRYQQAGLVIFGKTASPEFGGTGTTESILFGDTRNPWDMQRSAGGSSGGAAAAVAAGILPLANATDGGGSIRIPASCCGLFGMKPTRARITAGPETGEGLAGLASQHAVTWSVRDSAALLDATAGPLPGDPYFPPPPADSYMAQAGRDPGKLRIAFSTGAPNGAAIDADCVAATEKAARLCAELGHDVEEASPEFDV